MKEIIISYCIPVYNQSSLVQECIESIVQYKGTDIEIIISDDCSSENIEKVVYSFNDIRIKYFKNQYNLGHDLNIMNSFSKAKGKFAFLLRTRDHVYSKNIPIIIEFIKNNPNCAYITGTALDESGAVRYSYNNRIVPKGIKALRAHYNLYIHPSGSLYSLEKLEINEIQSFLKKYVKNKQSFIGHSLMRMYLAECGDFGFIKDITWIYIKPSYDDIAVNHAPSRMSVYDPKFIKERYLYVLLWTKESCNIHYWKYILINEYKLYLNASTWKFYFNNKDLEAQQHYSFKKRKFSVRKERNTFVEYSNDIIKKIFGKKMCKELMGSMRMVTIFNIFFGWEKDFVITTFRGKNIYKKIQKIYSSVKNIRY